jgi:hypothetical protein
MKLLFKSIIKLIVCFTRLIKCYWDSPILICRCFPLLRCLIRHNIPNGRCGEHWSVLFSARSNTGLSGPLCYKITLSFWHEHKCLGLVLHWFLFLFCADLRLYIVHAPLAPRLTVLRPQYIILREEEGGGSASSTLMRLWALLRDELHLSYWLWSRPRSLLFQSPYSLCG